MIRTFVAAQSSLARVGLAAVVRGDARLTLAGEGRVEDLHGGLAAFDSDVLLEARDTSLVHARENDVPTVALVDDPRDAWSRNAIEEDVGFALLASDAAPDEIVAAIVAVAAGLVAVQPRTLARTPGTRVDRLTPREIDVLRELAGGRPNKTIASTLGISEHTVKFHVAAIFAKLGSASRTEAVAQGVRHGLIML